MLADGSQIPEGETVAVTLNGVQKSAMINSSGAFTTTFSTSSLSVSGSSCTISYAYTSDGTFASASATSTLTVTQATPTITWANPADITYGTPLGASQLDATASVPGTFTYTPGGGTILKAGSGQTLSVSFTPTDSTDYATATATASINVNKAMPTITWDNPANILYGTALSGAQLAATASVPGTFTYTPGEDRASCRHRPDPLRRLHTNRFHRLHHGNSHGNNQHPKTDAHHHLAESR